jgi:hypothetical protein
MFSWSRKQLCNTPSDFMNRIQHSISIHMLARSKFMSCFIRTSEEQHQFIEWQKSCPGVMCDSRGALVMFWIKILPCTELSWHALPACISGIVLLLMYGKVVFVLDTLVLNDYLWML